MSDPGFSYDIQAPDITPDTNISLDDPAFQPPSIMGGLDWSGGNLPMRAQNDVLRPTARPAFSPVATQQPQASAAGIGKAFDAADLMVGGMHGAIGTVGNILKGDPAVLAGLKHATTAITAPFTVGSAIAGTVSDIHHGVPTDTAIAGNTARAILVTGAGLAGDAVPIIGPLAGPAAAWAADRYLPDAPTIGKVVLDPLNGMPGS